MSLLIIDYGMGNLGSVKRAFEECGADVLISDNPESIGAATHLVLPGVGAFADGMERLEKLGWTESIKKTVTEDQGPLLGICLGMQLLAEKGYENGNIQGLGLIPGKVIRFEPRDPKTRIPHVGWNEVSLTNENRLLAGISNNSDFYFVHSYHFVPEHAEHIIATTPYCDSFVSAINADNIFGVQFHPEKSSRAGFQLLRNFIKI